MKESGIVFAHDPARLSTLFFYETFSKLNPFKSMKKIQDYYGRILLRFLSKKTIRVMKLTLFLSILTISQLWATETYSQMTKLTLKLEDVKISDALKEIENQSEFFFLYSPKLVDVERKVNIDAEKESIKDILSNIFDDKVKFVVYDRQIILTPNDTTSLSAVMQQLKVTGIVTDASTGDALPGVNVVVKGTTIGAITDINGSYALNVTTASATLQFSFIGYINQEVVLDGRTTLSVALKSNTAQLNEVVIVGYGEQKKVNLTGAVTQVKVDKILGNRPVSNIADALQGSIPGLQITSASGRPGEAPSIDIRGIMSISGGSPLILVDNVPMKIEDINPTDIETISVMKDAASSSIYGGRAAFGIILISTKKGQRNQPLVVNYTDNFTISQPYNLPQTASTMEYINAFKAWGNTTYTTGQDLTTWSNLLNEYQTDPSKYSNGETYVNGLLYRLAQSNLYKKFMTNSFEQMHNLSFSGGSEKSDYRVSFGYANEDGIMVTNKDSYKKYNVNIYLNNNLTNKLISTMNILYNNDLRSTPSNYSLLFRTGITAGPWINSGFHTNPDGSTIPYDTPNNILAIEPPDKASGQNLRIFEKLDYNVMKDLKVTAEYTFMKSNIDTTKMTTDNQYWDFVNEAPVPITVRGSRSSSSYTRSYANTDYQALNLYANYEKKYNEHDFKFLAGTNMELSKYSYFSADRIDLLSTATPSLATATGTMTTGESFSDYSILGYFARMNYYYKNKYLFEANARYDGSSKFPNVGRYGFFPSFSAGWIITEESFVKPVENIINFMKIRGSWGKIGNQAINNYAFIPGLSPNSSSWIAPPTAIQYLTLSAPPLVSSSFTWETVRTGNIGVDMSFLNKRLNSSFDYFNRATLNMLGPSSELPAVIGAAAPEKNVANLVSKGWELSIEWKETKKDFSYSFGITMSDNRSFVTKFDNKGGLLDQYYDGYEFGQIWGYKTNGYYKVDDFVPGTLDANLLNGTLKAGVPAYYTTIVTNPGDIRYADLNGDGKISPGTNTLSDHGDLTIIGNNSRRYQFGITGSFAYKNFDFSFFFQGVGKRDIWINTSNEVYWPYTDTYGGLFKNELNYWTPDNINGFYPRSYASAGGNTPTSELPQTKYLLNGAYIMLKNIELSYSLQGPILEKLSIKYIKLFVTAENLLRFDHVPPGIDPEAVDVNSGGYYPFLRKISFGINASF
jgi:TonB-linked SusC/RagA family outer membrane protein